MDDRLGELHPLEDDGVVAIAQRVTGGDVLEAEPGDDVAGHGDVEVLALVGVHQQDAAETLAVFLGGVVDLFALADLAGVHAEVGQLAERVGDDLERQCGELLVLGTTGDRDLLAALHLDALGRRDVERARQEVDDGVEHRLHTLVLERRTAQDRHEVERQRALADRLLDVGLGELLTAEVLVHQRLVLRGDRLEHRFAVLVRLVDHVGGDVGDLVLRAESFSSTSRQTRAFILTRSTRPSKGLPLRDHRHRWAAGGRAGTAWRRSAPCRRCGRSRRRCGPSC